MSDIVERLRDKHCCDASKCNCDEAADEIERLRAALKQARRDALEEAARWFDENSKAFEDSDLPMKAAFHRRYAAAIRALADKE